MSVPLITVLMTVYNGEAYLKTAIESILNQTFKDFEFLIINDASNDSTLDLIKSFNDTRIIVHNNSRNLGQTASLNVGLKLAKGRYIARMDADDVSYSNRLEKQLDFIKRYSGKYAVVGTDMALIDINGNKKGVQRFPKTFTEIFLSIFYTTPVAHISALMDREMIIKVGGYKEDFIVVQDYDLWSRLIRIGYKLMNLNETLVAGRVHENSVLAMETNTRVPIENSRVIRQNVNLLTKVNISEDEALNIFYLFHLPHLLSPIAMKDTEALYKAILMNLKSDFPDRLIAQIRNRNLSKVYYRLGIHQIEDGNMRGARRSFIKSTYKNPLQIKPLILFLLSFLRKNHINKVRQKLSAIVPANISIMEFPPRIIFLINQFYPIIGGAERQAEILATKLTEKGVDITIVTGWWDRSIHKDEVIDRVKVHRCFILWIKINNTKIGGSFFSTISYFLYLLIHRNEYDLIQCFQVYNEVFIALIIGRIFGKTVVARNSSGGLTPDLDIIEDLWAGRFKKKYIINHLRHLIVTSQDSAKGFIRSGINDSIINYITNGVQVYEKDEREYNNKVSKVITVVRLARIRGIDWKGVDILVLAMREIVSIFPNIVLDVIGDGCEKETYVRMVDRLELSDNIRFLGARKDVGTYLQKSDIFVMASRTEGMSNALLEAMSYGLPCVTTAVGGNKEIIINGENGFLVEPEKPEKMAKAIIELIKDQGLRESIGKNARQTIKEKYSIDMIADRYLEFYNVLYNK